MTSAENEPLLNKPYLYFVAFFLYNNGAFKSPLFLEKYMSFLIIIRFVFFASIAGKSQVKKCFINSFVSKKQEGFATSGTLISIGI